MPRRRLGVVVLVDPPAGTEVDALRRAVGDGALGRIAPHITLVPPINVAVERLGEALGRLRAAAASVAGPFEVTLGPVGSFLPANPVLLLEVGDGPEPGNHPEVRDRPEPGEGAGSLRTVRDAVFAGPFERPLRWPWVPHVTLGDDLEPERIAAATVALDGYSATVAVERLTVLEEVRTPDGRRWVRLADAAVGPRRIVGRGGLELELTAGHLVDPEATTVLAAAGTQGPGPAAGTHGPGPHGPDTTTKVVLTARRHGGAVGVAAGWVDGRGTHVAVVVHPEHRRQGVGGHLLAALESDLDATAWAAWPAMAYGPGGFYRARSGRCTPAGPGDGGCYSKAIDE